MTTPSQLQGQLEGQGQGQGEGQSQSQSSWDGNWNGNGNGNLNGNGNGNLNGNGNFNADGNFNANGNLNADANLNGNANFNTDTVCVNVCVDASVSPGQIYLNFDGASIDASNGGSLVFMPQYLDPTISGGAGNDTIISLDQVNSLVASNYADGNSVSMGPLQASGDGAWAACDGSAGGDGHGDGAMDVLSGNTISAGGGGTIGPATAGDGGAATASSAATAQLDAFTQSIVLGANIQYNNFSLNLGGHDVTTSGAHHG